MSKRILTGIKPTGTPHLGNYFGMFEPALRTLSEYDESFMFVANMHALNQIQDARKLEELTISVTASWLACGLDTDKTHLYLQSDIPEDQVLETLLHSFTPKGWMNKAHAYKAAADANTAAGKPVDDGISMGLYTYPVLMAADILLFDANVVPVGKDQVQHVEIARDIALRINHHYKTDVLVPPEHRVRDDVNTIIGTDGRKMSKSYHNVIPIFASHDERAEAVKKIVTDSSAPDAKKTVEGTPIYEMYKLVANEAEVDSYKQALEQGQMGWGEAKSLLAKKLDERFSEMTERYNQLIAHPDEIKQILARGAENVRPVARKTLTRVKDAMGIL